MRERKGMVDMSQSMVPSEVGIGNALRDNDESRVWNCFILGSSFCAAANSAKSVTSGGVITALIPACDSASAAGLSIPLTCCMLVVN